MNRAVVITLVVLGGLVLFALSIVGWGISVHNKIVTNEEAVKAGWAQVQNQYQRRFDLIPNLIETVKGFAKQEMQVLTEVTEARASVGKMTVTPEVLNDPQAFAKFRQAQDGLSSALSRLLVVTENYPTLKSDVNFLTLQKELEGTENRIAVERRRFNEAVREYNTMIRKFPASFIASFSGFKEKAYFDSIEGAEKPPQVKF
ncbi:MAG: LemA family protein [bacterium]